MDLTQAAHARQVAEGELAKQEVSTRPVSPHAMEMQSPCVSVRSSASESCCRHHRVSLTGCVRRRTRH